MKRIQTLKRIRNIRGTDKHKQLGALFRAIYTRAFICYGLMSCVFYFVIMLVLRKPIVPDIYLALNLIVPAVLWFLIGLAINRWAQKAGSNPVPWFKIAIAIAVLILIHQAVSAIIVRHPETVIPIVGNWLTFNVFLDSEVMGIPRRSISAFWYWAHLPLALLLGIFPYRAFCFGTAQSDKRLLAVFLSLFIAGILNGKLMDVLYGGRISFISVRNFINLGFQDIHDYVFLFVMLQLIFFELKESDTTLKAYFKYEASNIKALVPKIRKKTKRIKE
ncbi:MAG: hypothetical protein FWC97_11710 [Treponema sp.]|nr:hypothetical protein [Treponema sp.]